MFHVEQYFKKLKYLFMKIAGLLVDIHKRDIYPAAISVENGIITKIQKNVQAPAVYLIPGLIDSHVHIESSMVTPGAFAVAAVQHGTTGVVSDPHEIANVIGKKGVIFMIRDAKKVPVNFYFGAPSCVPATEFESSGASLNHNDVNRLLEMDEIKYLSEMMNYPGVVNNDNEVNEKLKSAHRLGKPIDGHAPGLTGEILVRYVKAGISTDHECVNIEEAREKLSLGTRGKCS
jgi:adenine deaminase